MTANLIRALRVEQLDAGPQPDVLIELRNGKIVQISPDFNTINVWSNKADFEAFDLDRRHRSLDFDMGGTAAGAYNE